MNDDKKQIDKRKKENYDIEKNGVFFCQPCWIAWDDDGMESVCPGCGAIREKVHHMYKNLIKSLGTDKSQTEDGKAAISRAIAERNHTSMSDKQKERVRLNAVKHGRYMLVSGVYPAKRDKYVDCKTCPIYNQCDNSGYCATKTDKLMEYRLKFLAAYKNGDVESLDDYAGEIQADNFALLKDMFADLFERGPVLEETVINAKEKEPVYFTDDDGQEKILKKVQAHPVLQHIYKFLETLGMTADQRKMTQKSKDQITGDDMEKVLKELFGIESKDDEDALNAAGIEVQLDIDADDEN